MDSVQPKSDGQSNRDPIILEADHLCFLDVEASIIVFTSPISDVQNRHETESKRESQGHVPVTSKNVTTSQYS
jgi:hypothetical protein